MSPGHRGRIRLLISSLLAGLALLAAGCGGGGGSLPEDVTQALDVSGESIANVAGGQGESIDTVALLEAVNRASRLGAPVRVVIVGPDTELVSATSVVERYGGTALSYKTGDLAFQAYSDDLDRGQLDLATQAAAGQNDIGDSANAFVGVLERDGIQPASGSSSFGWLWWLLVAVAALFLLQQILRFLRARKRRDRLQNELETRRSSLADWAADLGPEVDALAGPVSMRGNPRQNEQLAAARLLAQQVPSSARAATSVNDLDAAEIRVARAFMQLREIRRSLGV